MADRPSLLVLLTDQGAISSLGCYGNEQVETPNVDALAARGTRFERAYCAQPVCTPSRSAIMTGRYPHTTGLTENNTPLPPEERCLPELGDFGAYATAYVGKWDLGDEIFAQHGFEEWVSIDDGYRDQYTRGDPAERSSYHEFLVEAGFSPDTDDGTFSRGFAAGLPEEYGKPAFLADRAIDFLEAHREEPFVLFVSFLEPHPPYTGPRDDQYDPADVVLPRNFEHGGFDDQPLSVRAFRAANRRPEEAWREIVSNYWGLASLVDTHAGRILDALAAEGRVGETVTVYTSDHGTMMGSQGLCNKNVLFEEAARVPWLLDVPGLDGAVVEHPVSQIDLLPTLLDALGADRPDRLQGHSLLPFLRGDTDEPVEPDVFVEGNGPDGDGVTRRKDEWPASGSRPAVDPDVVAALDADERTVLRALQEPVRTVVTPDGWKLTYRRDGEHELYDLAADPGETENLAGREEGRVEELFGRILDWQVRTRDPVYLA